VSGIRSPCLRSERATGSISKSPNWSTPLLCIDIKALHTVSQVVISGHLRLPAGWHNLWITNARGCKLTGLVQLYQRLSARATSYFLSSGRNSVTHTVRTEITVEHESRVWLLRENPRETSAQPREPGAAPVEPVRCAAISALPASSSTKPNLEGESR